MLPPLTNNLLVRLGRLLLLHPPVQPILPLLPLLNMVNLLLLIKVVVLSPFESLKPKVSQFLLVQISLMRFNARSLRILR